MLFVTDAFIFMLSDVINETRERYCVQTPHNNNTALFLGNNGFYHCS